jgi:hypothetical protein
MLLAARVQAAGLFVLAVGLPEAATFPVMG